MHRKSISSTVFFCLAAMACWAQGNTFPASGNVGIGTASPITPIHVRSTGSAAFPSASSKGDALHFLHANNNGLEFGVANGTNTRRAWILARHSDTENYGQIYATLHLQPELDVTAHYRGVAIGFPASVHIPLQVGLAVQGNVGIGTTDPQAKLAVEGNILAREVKVKTDITVPDYVFEPDYQLTPLAEVEAYVKEHRHLPEIPSATDIQRDGLDLAEMNLLLLKKVEELTLHAITQDKHIKQQAKLMADQRRDYDELKKWLTDKLTSISNQ